MDGGLLLDPVQEGSKYDFQFLWREVRRSVRRRPPGNDARRVGAAHATAHARIIFPSLERALPSDGRAR